jgi:hypothetical protein
LKSRHKGILHSADRTTMLAMLRRISAMDGYGDRMFRPGNRRLGQDRASIGCETAQDMRDTNAPAPARPRCAATIWWRI